MTHLCGYLQVEQPMFVNYMRNEGKKLHCAFWYPSRVTEFRQTDDQEGKLFTHTRESESTGIYLVHRAFYGKIRCLSIISWFSTCITSTKTKHSSSKFHER